MALITAEDVTVLFVHSGDPAGDKDGKFEPPATGWVTRQASGEPPEVVVWIDSERILKKSI